MYRKLRKLFLNIEYLKSTRGSIDVQLRTISHKIVVGTNRWWSINESRDMKCMRTRADEEDAQAQNIPRVEAGLSRVIEEKARSCSSLPDRFTVTWVSSGSRSIKIHYCPRTGCNTMYKTHVKDR